jgi:hypothetical protein
MSINPISTVTAPNFYSPRSLTGAAPSRLDAVALNPQPLPPKESWLANRFDAVALNPQPLPPKESPFGWMERLGLGRF